MNYLITIIGPTAIGKTALSIALAQHFGCDIISCDSRQFFKEMKIGTAVPSDEELSAAKHLFIQNKSIFESYSVGDFEQEALTKLDELFQKNNIQIMVGGSGLYVDAVLKGFDVALLPFKRDEVSNTIFPLKLFEYLGAGKPLVAINFNDDLVDFTGDTVAYCSDAASFSSAITKALETNNEDKKLQRIQIARNNTWQVRITKIADILANALELKREKAV